MDFLALIKEYYEFIIGVVTAAISWFGIGRITRRNKKIELDLDSKGAMLRQIEKLNLKLTELFDKQVDDAQRRLELELTIQRLEAECPNCVRRILNIIEEESNEQNS